MSPALTRRRQQVQQLVTTEPFAQYTFLHSYLRFSASGNETGALALVRSEYDKVRGHPELVKIFPKTLFP